MHAYLYVVCSNDKPIIICGLNWLGSSKGCMPNRIEKLLRTVSLVADSRTILDNMSKKSIQTHVSPDKVCTFDAHVKEISK